MSLFPADYAARFAARCTNALSHLPACRPAWEAALSALSGDEAHALRYLIAYSPWTDLVSCDTDLFLAHVRHALRLWRAEERCRAVPPEIFLPYVLHPRVNDEPLTDHRPAFWADLAPRIAGMGLYAAAVEVNYWCCEQAAYRLTDARTLPPDAVARNACGRCGEESTLTVAVLRSAGIPARQVYAPRWAHCDDNHAWVEAWTGDGWHYLGACEPWPSLDQGWFTCAASRAPLIHTRAFFDYAATLDGAPLCSDGICCTLNRTPAYAACRVRSVEVRVDGMPAPGAQVRFEVLNYGAFHPVCTLTADATGRVSAELGRVDVHIHAFLGDRWAACLLDADGPDTQTLALESAPAAESPCVWELGVPAGIVPAEDVLSPVQAREHAARMQRCACARGEREAAFSAAGGVLAAARGNRREIERFLTSSACSREEQQTLLDTLSAKDWTDCTAAALEDALEGALPYRGTLPADTWQRWVLAPRVALERLAPERRALRAYFAERNGTFHSGDAVAAWLAGHLRAPELPGYPGLVARPADALAAACADGATRDLTFVAVCRAFGIPARLEPLCGEAQWLRGEEWLFAFASVERAGAILRVQQEGGVLIPGETLSLSRLENGMWSLLNAASLRVGEDAALTPGRYRITATSRQIDGAQRAHVYEIELRLGELRELAVRRPTDRTAEKVVHIPLPLPQDQTPPRSIVCFVEPGEEPSEHLLVELGERAGEYRRMGIGITLCARDDAGLEHPAVARLGVAVPALCTALFTPEQLHAARAAMGVGDQRLPFSIALGNSGEGLWAFANYNVGTAQLLLEILQTQ